MIRPIEDPRVDASKAATGSSQSALGRHLPSGSELLQYRWCESPHRIGPRQSEQKVSRLPAVLESSCAIIELPQLQHVAPERFSVVLIPAPESFAVSESVILEHWTSQGTLTSDRKPLSIQLQGCNIFWSVDRAIVVASADRLNSVRDAIVEASYFDARLTHIEAQIEGRWGELEIDNELSFLVEERNLRRRQELQKRYREILSLRAELARLTPLLHFPATYPPTLASQIGERLRERNRMVERADFLSEQLEVFERVYENCGQRVSDFILHRSGNTLEWIIILLLLTQTILVVVEMLSTSGS